MTPAGLCERIGANLEAGEEEGIGKWLGIGLELSSGRRVEMLTYLDVAAPYGFDLHADSRDDLDEAKDAVLKALKLPAAAVLWVPPKTGDVG